MKINKILFMSLISSVMLMSSCGDWLDVNTDPNNLGELNDPEIIMPVAQLNIATALMGWDAGFGGGIWSQYWTQKFDASQFKTLEKYESTDYSYMYSNLVSYALNDLKEIKKIAGEGTGDYYIAEALSIFAWQTVTDTWGDIPYSEALRGDEGIYSPILDTQESIYTDLLVRVNALLDTDNSGTFFPTSYDFIYGGDMSSWTSFTKSLKLKLMIRLSETSGYNNSALLTFVEQGGFITENALVSGSIWQSKDGKQHPMVEFQEGGAGYLGTNVSASKTMIDYLNENEDSRIGALYTPISTGDYVGAFQGDYASNSDSDQDGVNDEDEEYSGVEFDATSDLIVMSTWEVNFYIAEVYARASNNVKAKEYYDAGVQASCDYWGVENNITAAGALREWTDGTVEEGVKQIAMQKWVSYCKVQHHEAFLERNRTKYPSLNMLDIGKTEATRLEASTNFPVGEFTLSVAGRGTLSESLPSSPTYSDDLIKNNNNINDNKADLSENVWWNQKAGK